jgi:uncharacterized damage-inducible protein DinB
MMLDKQEFLLSIAEEMKIIRHVFSKIPADTYEYRPTEKQRSTLELLQYLSHIGATLAHALKEGNTSGFKAASEASAQVTPETFLAALDAEEKEVASVLNSLSDEELNAEVELFGVKESRRRFFIDMVLKHLVAYRMQLFLYAKQAGASDLNTLDAWRGVSGKMSM